MTYKQYEFLNQITRLTSYYDGDGNGMCESYEKIIQILKKEYPILFEAYKNLK